MKLISSSGKSTKREAEYIYVIYRAEGPYGKKLCPRSCVRPEAAGRVLYSRPRAQFFPIQTDLGPDYMACMEIRVVKID